MSYRPALILSGFALLFATLLTPAAQAQDAQAFGYFGPPASPPQHPTGTLSKMHGAMVPAKLTALTLEKMDNHALAVAADNEPHEGKPLKIGVGRQVAFDAAMGSWFNSADGGRLWVMEISSPGAVGMRVQFTDLHLPAGAQLVAYAATDPWQIGGPYEGAGDFGTGEQYSPTLFDDRVRIEYYVPKGRDAGPLPFDVPSIQHIFRDPIKSGFGDVTSAEGTCHNDVTCFAAWANVAKAVGRYSFVDAGNTYLCSGQLIAKTVPDNTPYFITARHCVSTSTVAATVDIYWLYQTSTCNGAAPNLASVPQTLGATLKATRTNSDGTLLQLTGSLPGGLYWVGWRTAAVTNGTAVACIHHPDAAYKRISFGTATDQAGCSISGVVAENVRSDWVAAPGHSNIGVTEGGSSGGGLYIDDANQQLIGTLSCGPSSCGATAGNLNDGFGRFASFYPDISSFLGAAATDDSFEPDDTCATAHAIAVVAGTPVTNSGLIVRSASEDWYSYSVPAGNTLTVGLSFTNASGNIDEALYTTCGGSIISSSVTTNNTESVTYTNAGGSAQAVYVRVYLASGTTNTYAMTSTLTAPAPTDDSFEPDDTCATAHAIAVVAGTPVTNSGLIVRSVSEDWYSYSIPAGNTLTVGLSFTNSSGNIDEALYTTCGGSIISSSVTTNNTESVTYTNAGGSAQAVYVRVYLASGTTNTYAMTSTLTAPATFSDSCAGAVTVVSGGTYSGTTVGMTIDGATNCTATQRADVWYKFTSGASAVRLSLDTCTSANDTMLSVHSACPGTAANQLVCNDDAAAGVGPCGSASNTTSYAQYDLTANQTVYIRVAMYGATSNTFVLHVNAASLSVPNDVCTTAIAIGQGATAFNNTNALSEGPTETACNFFNFSGIARDMWYSFVMPSHGDLTVDTCGSTFDTKLALYDTCPTSGGTPLMCDDDASPACAQSTLNSRVSATGASSGHVFYIRVGGYRTAAGADRYGAGTLNVTFNATAAPCIPDMGGQGGTVGPDSLLDNNDFVVFINLFFNSDPIADIGVQGGLPGTDTLWDNNDFVVFINDFFLGCP